MPNWVLVSHEDIDKQALEKAVNDTLDRQELLRMRIEDADLRISGVIQESAIVHVLTSAPIQRYLEARAAGTRRWGLVTESCCAVRNFLSGVVRRQLAAREDFPPSSVEAGGSSASSSREDCDLIVRAEGFSGAPSAILPLRFLLKIFSSFCDESNSLPKKFLDFADILLDCLVRNSLFFSTWCWQTAWPRSKIESREEIYERPMRKLAEVLPDERSML